MQKTFGIIFAVVFVVMVILNPAFGQSGIPTWVKNNAGWWADDLVSDRDFTSGIQFLMGEGLLSTNPIPDEFPFHLKAVSRDWADGKIIDDEYLLILENWIESYNEKTAPLSIPSSSYVELDENNQNQIGSDSNFEIGLKAGQWIKYMPSISSGGFDIDMKKFLEPLVNSLKEQANKESGFDIDNAIWIKYTVADISGTNITFDRTVKLASDPATRDEYVMQSILAPLSPENKIDESLLDSVYEKKLESRQFDLTEFHPSTFVVMPTDLEFGSKFEGTLGYGEITFSSISKLADGKSNLFTAHDIVEQNIRLGVVENTLEFDTVANFDYSQQSGILLKRYVDTQFTNLNTYESGWITVSVSVLDYSDDLKQNNAQRLVNDKNEILEKLSYFFVESADSRYLLMNPVDSIGEPKRTTFDIISARDGSELGALILHGDDIISSVTSSTVFTGLRNMNEADDIHIMIRQALVPGCCYPLPTHSTLLMDNIDEDHAQAEATFDDAKISLGWVETNPTYQIGVFAQEITFLEEDTSKQNTIKENIIEQDDMPRQLKEVAKSAEQNSEDVDISQESSEEINYGSAALGAFFFLGIPAIIIGLIIWKIKQRRARRK